MIKNQTAAKNDNRYLNYITLSTMITQAMQRRHGKFNVDFDLASDIAWDVSQQISSDVIIDRARSLTVDEILQSQSVLGAELSRRHGIEYAKKRPPEQSKPTNRWGFFLGIVGLIITLGALLIA